MRIKDILSEVHYVTLTAPDSEEVGAWIRNQGKDEPVVILPVGKITTFEPIEKTGKGTASIDSENNVRNIMRSVKKGRDVPPILVMKTPGGFQVIDGHHRLEAYKRLGKKSIPARMVSTQRIRTKS